MVVASVTAGVLVSQAINGITIYNKAAAEHAKPPIINVENLKVYRGHILVYVRNMGTKPYYVDKIYVYSSKGTLASQATQSAQTSFPK